MSVALCAVLKLCSLLSLPVKFGLTLSLMIRVPRSQRSLNTTKHLNSIHDVSTIDFAYMPQEQLSTPPESESFRVPLLPDNFSPPLEHTNNAHHDVHMESVTKPQIATVSANGTHIDNPSAMSDVTDNHSMINEVNVYDLTQKVSNAAASKWESITDKTAAPEEENRGVVNELLHGFVEEIFGGRRPARV